MAEHKKIVIVDECDQIIGAEDALVAKINGVLRRASRVFIFNEKGDFLVQRRSKSVFQPLLLDQSVGGHVDEGETYKEAAEREMREELGLNKVPLQELTTSYRTKSHFNGIYTASISSNQEILFNKDEVAEVIWYNPDELTKRMKECPTEFTESFPKVWQDLRDKLISS